jgi:hypothetical protein
VSGHGHLAPQHGDFYTPRFLAFIKNVGIPHEKDARFATEVPK